MTEQQPSVESLGGSEAPHILDYYSAIRDAEISHTIHNFDDKQAYQSLEGKVCEPTTNNFLVDFGDDEAWCGFDLGSQSIKKLLKAPRPPNIYTRWINIYKPAAQKDVLKTLAKFYDFSPRLLGVMCTEPPPPSTKSTESSQNSSLMSKIAHPRRTRHPSDSQQTSDLNEKESEKFDRASEMEASLGTTSATDDSLDPQKADLLAEMNHYRVAEEIWHWSTIDWGRRYVCLGYNSIYNTGENSLVSRRHGERDLPAGHRSWTWLLLCEGRTVISITEDPFPYHSHPLSKSDRQVLRVIRRNIFNVFQQLSYAHDSTKDHPIQRLPIRKRVGNSTEEAAHRPTDAPGILLYCLFDDWYTTYSLVARREQRFAHELNELREEMLTRADLDHIKRLHHLGRQLGVLKRLYQSHELLIDRILEKQEASLASLKNSNIISGNMEESVASAGSQPQIHEMESLLGVALSSAARARFERLKHRIRLYALSEIQECLNQQDSLVMMNFNLIAIKESYSVERLTRVTLLLAKVTILFMPVSLSTAYFGTSIVDAQFTQKQYWISFAVVVTLSVLLLLGFSLISGTMEGKMLYKPMGRKFLDSMSGKRKRRREKKEI